MMNELPYTHPSLYNLFQHGYHTVRRSDRYWGRLSTDLVIEQSLMRALKSRGGLTRGRGMTEAVRLLWVHLTHKCAEIHEVMTDISNTKLITSDQHVELRLSRKERDCEDLVKMLNWLHLHNPFTPLDPNLKCLDSGQSLIKGSNKINCDNAEQVGSDIHRDR